MCVRECVCACIHVTTAVNTVIMQAAAGRVLHCVYRSLRVDYLKLKRVTFNLRVTHNEMSREISDET